MRTKTYFVTMTDENIGKFVRAIARTNYAHIKGIHSHASIQLSDQALRGCSCAIAVQFMKDNSDAESMIDNLGHSWEMTEQASVGICDEKNEEKVYHYKVFPPFIDAYRESKWEDEASRKTLSEIEDLAKLHAREWGDRAVGCSMLKTGSGPYHGEVPVVCCVVVDYHRKYLVVTNGKKDGKTWQQNLHFIEGGFPREWDVT